RRLAAQPDSEGGAARQRPCLQPERFRVVFLLHHDTDPVLVLALVEGAVELAAPRPDEPFEAAPCRSEQLDLVGGANEHHGALVALDLRRFHLLRAYFGGPLEALRSYSVGCASFCCPSSHSPSSPRPAAEAAVTSSLRMACGSSRRPAGARSALLGGR